MCALGGIGLVCLTVVLCAVVIFSLLSFRSVLAPVLQCFSAEDVGRGRPAPLCEKDVLPPNSNFADAAFIAEAFYIFSLITLELAKHLYDKLTQKGFGLTASPSKHEHTVH